ncbi:hypothetical protein QBZ16_000577 [Prototheca wickerhamii]|uniref:Formin-like protein n=1 Tax=Prototheca wickerhamii TaxID=3111 RepID=A0AAD9ILV0_PROWI|nr:hypothetical protein QBZ16_000577 [Prototheca wickerhamii]
MASAVRAADFKSELHVPPETAPELFVSMARGQEIAKAEAHLLAYGASRPGINSVAVSVLVIKSLTALKAPLLSAHQCQQLLELAFSKHHQNVRLTCMSQILCADGRPQYELLKRLVRYCCELIAVPDAACTRKGLARTLGPCLLQPELFGRSQEPRQLTHAAIWVLGQMIECAVDKLTAQRRQKLEARVRELVVARAAAATEAPGAKHGQAPGRLVNPINTLKTKASSNWLLAAKHGPLDPDPGPASAQGPHALGRQLASRSGEPLGSLASSGDRPRAALSGDTTSAKSLSGGLPSARPSRYAPTGPLDAVPAILLRQQELKAALKPPSAAETQPDKSPWRPPGSNSRVVHRSQRDAYGGAYASLDEALGGAAGSPTGSSASSTGSVGVLAGLRAGAGRDDGLPSAGERAGRGLPQARHEAGPLAQAAGQPSRGLKHGEPPPEEHKTADAHAQPDPPRMDRWTQRTQRAPRRRAAPFATPATPLNPITAAAATAAPLWVHTPSGTVMQRAPAGEGGVPAFLPAGLSLDDLLQAAEDLQPFLPAPLAAPAEPAPEAPAPTPTRPWTWPRSWQPTPSVSSRKKTGTGKAPPPPPPPPGTAAKPTANADGVAKKLSLTPPSGAKENTASSDAQSEEESARRLARKLRLKQLHWDKLKAAGAGTVWERAAREQGLPGLDFAELEQLFHILENDALARLARGAKAGSEVRLVEHRRAHNICIELSGIRRPFAEIKAALVSMDARLLSVEQLGALSRAVPDDGERRDLEAYLKGEHPKHRGVSDVERLGTVERYFLEIKDIPRLSQRIRCLIFLRTFGSTAALCADNLALVREACRQLRGCAGLTRLLTAVLELGNHLNAGTHRGAAAGFRLDTLLKLADVKGVDRKTSLLHFVVRQLLDAERAQRGTAGGDGQAGKESNVAVATGQAVQADTSTDKQETSAEPPSPPSTTQPSVLGLETLPRQLAATRPAAGVQLSSIKGMVEELRANLKLVADEIVHAARAASQGSAQRLAEDDGSNAANADDGTGNRRFSELMAAFHVDAAARCAELEAEDKAMYEDLQGLAEYFGEPYKPADPARPVCVMRDFVLLFEKVLREIKANEEAAAAAAKHKAALKGGAATAADRALVTPSTNKSTQPTAAKAGASAAAKAQLDSIVATNSSSDPSAPAAASCLPLVEESEAAQVQAVVSGMIERVVQAEATVQINSAAGKDAEATQSEACPPDNLQLDTACEATLVPAKADEGWDFEDLELAFPVL